MSADCWTLVNYNGIGSVDFATEAEALEAAEYEIRCYCEDGEWSWEVKETSILHNGSLAYRCVEVPLDMPEHVKEQMEDDPDYVPSADYWADYVMQPVQEQTK